MKKRKELDALLGHRSKGSYEQMKKKETNGNGDVAVSSSSREADVYFQRATTYRIGNSKKQTRSISDRRQGCLSRRCFYVCLPLGLLALIGACVTSSIGIVYMQVRLKADMDDMKEKIFILEKWRSDEAASLSDIQSMLTSLQQEMVKVKEGDKGLRSIQGEVAAMHAKLEEGSRGYSASTVHEKVEENVKVVATLSSDLVKTQEKLEVLINEQKRIRNEQSEMKTAIELLHERSSTTSLQEGDALKQCTSSMNKHERTMNASLAILDAKLQTVTQTSFMTTEKQSKYEERLEKLQKNVSSLSDSLYQMGKTRISLHGDGRGKQQNKVKPAKKVDASISISGIAGAYPLDSDEAALASKSNSLPFAEQSPPDLISPSHNSNIRVGDTTSSFTESPTRDHDKR